MMRSPAQALVGRLCFASLDDPSRTVVVVAVVVVVVVSDAGIQREVYVDYIGALIVQVCARSPGSTTPGDPGTPEPSSTHNCECSSAPKNSSLLKPGLDVQVDGVPKMA